MVKAEWGAKRACPKCNTRFYDLGNDDPVTCIACGQVWVPEPMLKSKQPLPFETAKPVAKTDDDGETTGDDEDLDLVAEAEDAEEPDVDLGDDDEDLAAVVTGDDDEEA